MYLHIWLPFFLWAFKLKFFCWQQKMLFASIKYHVDVAVNVAQIFTKSCQTQHIETNDDDTRNEQNRRIFLLFNRHYWVCSAMNSNLSRILDETRKEILDMSRKVRMYLSNEHPILFYNSNSFSSHLDQASHSNMTAIFNISALLSNKRLITFPASRCKLKITINIFTQE